MSEKYAYMEQMAARRKAFDEAAVAKTLKAQERKRAKAVAANNAYWQRLADTAESESERAALLARIV